MAVSARGPRRLATLGALCVLVAGATAALGQDRQPWSDPDGDSAPRSYDDRGRHDTYGSGSVDREPLAPPPQAPSYERPPSRATYGQEAPSSSGGTRSRYDDAYRPPAPAPSYDPPYAADTPRYGERPPAPYGGPDRGPAYGERYEAAPAPYRGDRGGNWRSDDNREAYNAPPRYDDRHDRPSDGTFSMHEINDAGHQFFGSISQGLASVIEHAFRKKGRPNGYILGEDLGGAFVAGLRYGEGRLYTKDAGTHKIYWQGPSIGYDAGAEGSKVMVLVYNLQDPSDIFNRFAGVDGSAYVVGGVGLTFLSNNDVVLAPIRSGIGLRLGANIGYLKYTRRPTWNPF